MDENTKPFRRLLSNNTTIKTEDSLHLHQLEYIRLFLLSIDYYPNTSKDPTQSHPIHCRLEMLTHLKIAMCSKLASHKIQSYTDVPWYISRPYTIFLSMQSRLTNVFQIFRFEGKLKSKIPPMQWHFVLFVAGDELGDWQAIYEEKFGRKSLFCFKRLFSIETTNPSAKTRDFIFWYFSSHSFSPELVWISHTCKDVHKFMA